VEYGKHTVINLGFTIILNLSLSAHKVHLLKENRDNVTKYSSMKIGTSGGYFLKEYEHLGGYIP
jgi:hypothetical protein